MERWRYETTEDFGQAPLERLANFPRHPDLVVYAVRLAANLGIRLILRTWHRLEVAGRENLPRAESFIMVANHASHLDTVSLQAALPLLRIHRAFPAAAQDYFFTSVGRLAFSAVVVNAMPFDRKENPKQSLDLCRQLLETPGHILILFPEGTRSADGTMGVFKPGIGLLAAVTGVPVVPCRIEGAFRAWPKGAWLPRPRKLQLTIGAPMRFEDAPRTREGALAIADALRQAVAELAFGGD